jgi:hypothetical protein
VCTRYRYDGADGNIQVGCEWLDGEREFGSVPLPDFGVEVDTPPTSIAGLSLQGNALLVDFYILLF